MCWITLTLYFAGYALDGGLYFPEKIPEISQDEMDQWSSLSYPDLLKKIMPLFISPDEVPVADLHGLIDNSFKKFSGKPIKSCPQPKPYLLNPFRSESSQNRQFEKRPQRCRTLPWPHLGLQGLGFRCSWRTLQLLLGKVQKALHRLGRYFWRHWQRCHFGGSWPFGYWYYCLVTRRSVYENPAIANDHSSW